MSNNFTSTLTAIIDQLGANSGDEDIKQEYQRIKDNIKSSLKSDMSISFEDSDKESFSFLSDMKDSELSKNIGGFLSKFEKIPKQVSDLRSSYLPVESLSSYYQNFTLGEGNFTGESVEVSDQLALKESYENTFMRILGMPESIDIPPDADIFIMNPFVSGGSSAFFSIKKVKFSDLYSEVPLTSGDGLDILDERQRDIATRKFQFSGHSLEQVISDLAKANEPQASGEQPVGTNVDNDSGAKSSIPLDDINQNFDKLSSIFYLKLPPIQDSRFAKCINEPGKIVSKPFDDKFMTSINSEQIKTSFLENLIRIRLDKISGRIYDTGGNLVDGTSESRIGEYSIFEQYLFEKLLSILRLLSKQYNKTVKEIVSKAKNEKKKKDDYEKTFTAAAAAEAKASGETENTPSTPESSGNNKNLEGLRDIIEIQEAVLFILKDTSSASSISTLINDSSKSQSLYAGYIRNMSGYDDGIISSLISVIESETSVYRTELERMSKVPSSGDTDDDNARALKSKADTIIGTETIPVGIADIIIFALSLFSLPESDLINLLNSKQKENLRKILAPNSTVDQLFGSVGLNETSPVGAVNALTLTISAFYSLFMREANEFFTEVDEMITIEKSVVDESEGIPDDEQI